MDRLRALFMFIVGAVLGYWIVFYYTDLLWVRGTASMLLAAYVIAPAGAVICGIISAYFVRGVLVFAAATLIGYVVVLFGWLTYADLFDIADREGGKGMTMIFILAPAGGAMIGLIAAGLLARRRLAGAEG